MNYKEALGRIKSLIKREMWEFTPHAVLDMIKHSYTSQLVYEAFQKGEIFEDIELYGKEANLKYKGKNYYCIHFYKVNQVYRRGILISFLLTKKIKVIHVSPCGKEAVIYRSRLKDSSFKE